MAKYSSGLDEAFQALADPTRREVIGRLGAGPAAVGELAGHFDMALPSFLKHIRTLETAGWITTEKSGRVRTCTLRPSALGAVDDWLAEQRALWRGRTDRLEQFVLATQSGLPARSADPDGHLNPNPEPHTFQDTNPTSNHHLDPQETHA